MTRSIQNIPELTQFQFDVMVVGAEGENLPFVAMEPSENDSPERQAMIRKDLEEIGQLIGWGLVQDVSDRFKDAVNASRESKKHSFRVMQLTEAGYRLFHAHDDRTQN